LQAKGGKKARIEPSKKDGQPSPGFGEGDTLLQKLTIKSKTGNKHKASGSRKRERFEGRRSDVNAGS